MADATSKIEVIWPYYKNEGGRTSEAVIIWRNGWSEIWR
jgi:hypothetical protein